MNVSRTWLQKYFSDELPRSEELAEALTFYSSEVEGIENDGQVLDVKVLPDRAAYALSHRGIAYELGAILNKLLIEDPLRTPLPEYPASQAPFITATISDPEQCPRYMAALIRGVQVAPSPEWLRIALTTIGQRSINNIVDATNYVMLNIGQPLHAFDASRLTKSDTGTMQIAVKASADGEKITTLTAEEYVLPADTLLITDGISGNPLGIAGVKGGKAAEITSGTTDIIIESANFNGTRVRKASQALKLWTDASLRFQNNLSPELAAYGMRDAIALITSIAGGTVQDVIDIYPTKAKSPSPLSATVSQLNGILGTSFSVEEITDALKRLSFEYVAEGETLTVRPPFERRDLVIWQDLAEEVGRILGYDRVEPAELPAMEEAPDQKRFNGIERIKDILIEYGFTEISTQAFAAEGDVQLANPLQADRPWLRASLKQTMLDALQRAKAQAPRVMGVEESIKLFELGTVFSKEDELLHLCLGYVPLVGKGQNTLLSEMLDTLREALPTASLGEPVENEASILELSLKDVAFESLGESYEPAAIVLGQFTPYSPYPFALRDIAVWTPAETFESEVASIIQKEAGELLVRMDLFDRFEKDERTSYAYRLVFQSFERTLSDADLDPTMTQITDALNKQNQWQVR